VVVVLFVPNLGIHVVNVLLENTEITKHALVWIVLLVPTPISMRLHNARFVLPVLILAEALPIVTIVRQEPILIPKELLMYPFVKSVLLVSIQQKEVQVALNADQEPIQVLALLFVIIVQQEPILILVDLLFVLDVLRVRYQRQDQVVAVANVLQEPSLFLALKNVMDVLRDIIRVLEWVHVLRVLQVTTVSIADQQSVLHVEQEASRQWVLLSVSTVLQEPSQM
jgi:hypothetical protein